MRDLTIGIDFSEINFRDLTRVDNAMNEIEHSLNRMDSDINRSGDAMTEFSRRSNTSTNQVNRNLRNTQNESKMSFSAIKSIGAAFSQIPVMASKAMGLVTTITGGAFFKMGMDQNMYVENSTIAWTTLLKSSGKAANMVKQIQQFAANTQFDTEGVDSMAKYFYNAGYSGKQLFNELTKIADVSGAFNITADNAKELARQMSQVDQAGVAYTQDLDVLQNQGVPIFKAIAKEMGINVGAVRKMASNGKISADIYNKAFDSIAGHVKGASDKQSKTLTGMLSTLKDNLSMAAGQLIEPMFEQIKKAMPKLLTKIGDFTKGFKVGGLSFGLAEILPPSVFPTIDKAVKAAQRFVNMIVQNWPQIESVGLQISSILTDVANDVMDVANWIQNHWNGAITTVLALGGAFVTFKGMMAGYEVISTVTNLIKAFRAGTLAATAAELGLNAAMLANPATWVIAGIAALVGVGILLYRNWETIKNKAVELWTKFKWIRVAIMLLAPPIYGLIKLGILIYKNWDTIKSKVGIAIGAIKGFIGGLVDKWNGFKNALSHFKLPGWVTTLGSKIGGLTSKLVNGSHANGLGYVPFDGYVAELHRGEAVLTAKQADSMRKGGGVDNIPSISPSKGNTTSNQSFSPILNITVSGSEAKDPGTLNKLKKVMRDELESFWMEMMAKQGG